MKVNIDYDVAVRTREALHIAWKHANGLNHEYLRDLVSLQVLIGRAIDEANEKSIPVIKESWSSVIVGGIVMAILFAGLFFVSRVW